MNNKNRFQATQVGNITYAPLTLGAPANLHEIDREVFKQTDADKSAAADAKAYHREKLRRVYGKDWKKHLNVPEKSLGKTVKIAS